MGLNRAVAEIRQMVGAGSLRRRSAQLRLLCDAAGLIYSSTNDGVWYDAPGALDAGAFRDALTGAPGHDELSVHCTPLADLACWVLGGGRDRAARRIAKHPTDPFKSFRLIREADPLGPEQQFNLGLDSHWVAEFELSGPFRCGLQTLDLSFENCGLVGGGAETYFAVMARDEVRVGQREGPAPVAARSQAMGLERVGDFEVIRLRAAPAGIEAWVRGPTGARFAVIGVRGAEPFVLEIPWIRRLEERGWVSETSERLVLGDGDVRKVVLRFTDTEAVQRLLVRTYENGVVAVRHLTDASLEPTAGEALLDWVGILRTSWDKAVQDPTRLLDR